MLGLSGTSWLFHHIGHFISPGWGLLSQAFQLISVELIVLFSIRILLTVRAHFARSRTAYQSIYLFLSRLLPQNIFLSINLFVIFLEHALSSR